MTMAPKSVDENSYLIASQIGSERLASKNTQLEQIEQESISYPSPNSCWDVDTFLQLMNDEPNISLEQTEQKTEPVTEKRNCCARLSSFVRSIFNKNSQANVRHHKKE